MRWLVLLALVGCSSTPTPPDASPPFRLHIEVDWSADTTVTIDGVAVNAPYFVDETYASYVDAVGSYAPKSVVAMSGSASMSGLLLMYTCSHVPQDGLKSLGHLIEEDDTYDVGSDELGCYMGSCKGVDEGFGFATRSARTK